jgi:hypothetical protein
VSDNDPRVIEWHNALAYWRVRRVIDAERGQFAPEHVPALADMLHRAHPGGDGVKTFTRQRLQRPAASEPVYSQDELRRRRHWPPVIYRGEFDLAAEVDAIGAWQPAAWPASPRSMAMIAAATRGWCSTPSPPLMPSSEPPADNGPAPPVGLGGDDGALHFEPAPLAACSSGETRT